MSVETKPCVVCGAAMFQRMPGRARLANALWEKRTTCSNKCRGISIRGVKRPNHKGRPKGTPRTSADGIVFEVTFEQIGQVLGISGARAHQIYNAAMAKLRMGLGADLPVKTTRRAAR